MAVPGSGYDPVTKGKNFGEPDNQIDKVIALANASKRDMTDIQGQIDALIAAGANSTIGVFPAEDLTNTNDYVDSFGSPFSLFDRLRVNLKVTNQNTGPATFNYNSTSAYSIVDKEGNELGGSALKGTNELEYDLANTRWVLLNADSPTFEEVSELASIIDIPSTVVEAPISDNGGNALVGKGLTLQNIVNGENVLDGNSVSFLSIVGHNYYDSLNNVFIVGDGSTKTITNNTGSTVNIMVFDKTALNREDLTLVQLADISSQGYIDGVQSIKNPTMLSQSQDMLKSNAPIFYGSFGSTPSGAQDLFYFNNYGAWKYEAVKEYVLKSSDITAFDNTSSTNVAFVRIDIPSDYNSTGVDSAIDAKRILFSRCTWKAYADDVSTEETFHYFTSANGDISYVVDKSKYASLAEAQADLAGETVTYELATPEPPVQLPTPAVLTVYPNGQIVPYSDTFTGELTLQCPSNEAAAQVGQTYAVNANAKFSQLLYSLLP